MINLDHILNWRLLSGSHEFPGPDGGTCINEAALVAAGFEYKAIRSANDMPPCFSRPISQFLIGINDAMPHAGRQFLIQYIHRLPGTADNPEVEGQRAEYLAMAACNVFAAMALEAAGLDASALKSARTLGDAANAANAAMAAMAASAAARAAASATADIWPAVHKVIDGALAIGRQAPPLAPRIVAERLEAAKAEASA